MTTAADRVMSGTFGEVWFEGEKVAECYGLDAKVEFEKEEVSMCGKLAVDQKFMGYKCNGNVKMHKMNSRMLRLLSALIRQGINPRVQILSALKDPAAWGAERVLIKDASFNDMVLANWEAKKKGGIDAPFTFTDWDLLDTVAPR